MAGAPAAGRPGRRTYPPSGPSSRDTKSNSANRRELLPRATTENVAEPYSGVPETWTRQMPGCGAAMV